MLPWQGENEEHAIRILIQGNFKLFQHPFQFHDKTIRSMRRSHLQKCRGISISDLTHKNKLFRDLTTAGAFKSELCYKDKGCHVFLFVVEEKAREIRNSETSQQLAMLKNESRVL